MKVELKYIFECKDGFRVVKETPSEILAIMGENYQALQAMAKGKNDSCHCFIDGSNKYFPTGSMTSNIDGNYKLYELRTEIKVL